jgi:toxin-antitoxin system PIN domain toxin
VKLLDANVLLYAVHEEALHHTSAVAWLDRTLSSDETILLPWISLVAFLRLSTHRSVYERPQSVAEAMDTVEDWLAVPTVVNGEPRVGHTTVMRGLLDAAQGSGNLVNDAHLAALALQYDATVVSYDNAFGRFPGVRWERPTVGV